MYRINKLLKLDQKLVHTRDLALLWSISNPNTLYTTIKRYVQKGVLLPVHKGLYSTVPLTQIDPVRVGIAILHTYAYISCETVLAQAGIIFQAVPAITLVTTLSKKFCVNDMQYVARQLKPQFLYQTIGITQKDQGDGYCIASVERAVADMLYFNKQYHFDAHAQIDWDRVTYIQKKIGYL